MSEKVISKEQVEKTAGLARIQINEQEQEEFARELALILDNFKDINDIDVSDVEPFDHYELTENNLRDDEVNLASEETNELIKKNFPGRQDDYLKVKAVL